MPGPGPNVALCWWGIRLFSVTFTLVRGSTGRTVRAAEPKHSLRLRHHDHSVHVPIERALGWLWGKGLCGKRHRVHLIPWDLIHRGFPLVSIRLRHKYLHPDPATLPASPPPALPSLTSSCSGRHCSRHRTGRQRTEGTRPLLAAHAVTGRGDRLTNDGPTP